MRFFDLKKVNLSELVVIKEFKVVCAMVNSRIMCAQNRQTITS